MKIDRKTQIHAVLCGVVKKSTAPTTTNRTNTISKTIVSAIFPESNVGKQSHFRFNFHFHFHSIWLRRYTFGYMNVSMHKPCSVLFLPKFFIYFFPAYYFLLVVVLCTKWHGFGTPTPIISIEHECHVWHTSLCTFGFRSVFCHYLCIFVVLCIFSMVFWSVCCYVQTTKWGKNTIKYMKSKHTAQNGKSFNWRVMKGRRYYK